MSELEGNQERFQAMEAIFDHALGLKGAECAAYLRQACGSDLELLSQVEGLLRMHARAGESFLLPPDEDQMTGGSARPLRIGDYQVLGEIARGGMGIVYRARQPRLGRVVALKVIISGEMASAGEVARFLRETRAAGSLDHPNIVPIYEVGESSGVHYYSMRLLEGGTLARPLTALDTSPHGAARLLEKIAGAVQFAHEGGILHRDLKPANILLDALGEPHVSDFGLARLLGGEASLTSSGQVVGTASYMAPEQVSGRRGVVTAAADVYSLGAILYELLTARPPFAASSTYDTLEMVLRTEPKVPRALNPGIPADLERICLKCLEKDPGRRYATAAALAVDVRRFLNGEPVTARRIGPGMRAWRWCGRNPAAVTILLLLVVTAAVSIASALLWRGQRDRANINLRDSYREQARAGRWSRLQGQRLNGLELLSRAARLRASPDLRNEAIACMTCSDLVVDRCWEGAPPGTRAVALDLDMKHYARVAESGTMSIRRVSDDVELTTMETRDSGITSLLFSPDGRYLAGHTRRLASPGDLAVWEWRTGKRLLLLGGAIHGEAFDFSPMGPEVVFGHPDGTIRLVSLEAEGEREGSEGQVGPQGSVLLPAGPVASETLSFSPDRKRLLAASTASNTVRLWDLQPAASVRDFQYAGGVGAVAWHPGGAYFAAACQDFNIYVSRVDGDRPLSVLRGHGSLPISIAFNHAGSLLASVGWDGTLRLWHPFSGEELVKASSPLTAARGLQFRRDDGVLGYCRSHSSLWTYKPVLSDEHYLVGGDPEAAYSALSFSPDGRLLASTASFGAKVWCAATARELAHLRIGTVNWLVFQPGTGHLVTAGAMGLYIWPVAEDSAAPGHLQVGPPRRIADEIVHPRWLAVSADGGHLVVLRGTSGVAVLDLTRPASPRLMLSHPQVCMADISPGGRWLATASNSLSEVWIWDGISGDQVARLPGVPFAQVAFSADGRWLATSTTDECCLWEVGSWTRLRSFASNVPQGLPGCVTFSNDGRLLAVIDSPGTVRLLEPSSGEEMAKLNLSALQHVGGLRFGRSDTLLAGSRFHQIGIWDLRRIRVRLREMGLDWTDDPLPPLLDPGPPVQLEVDQGELDGKSR